MWRRNGGGTNKRPRGAADGDGELRLSWEASGEEFKRRRLEAVVPAGVAGTQDADDADLAEAMGLAQADFAPTPPAADDDRGSGSGSSSEEEEDEGANGRRAALPQGAAPVLTLDEKEALLLRVSGGSFVDAHDWSPGGLRLRPLRDAPSSPPRTCAYPSILHTLYWVQYQTPDGGRHPDLDVLRVRAKVRAAGVEPVAYDCLCPHPAGKPGWVGVPPAWGLSFFGLPRVDSRSLGAPMAPGLALNTSERTLRPEQVLAVERLEAQLRELGLAFLEADCGFGKSAVIFEVCRRLGRKTLYVVGQTTSMDQTVDNLLGTPAAYGWMPGARVGRLQEAWDAGQRARPGTKRAALCDWRDKDFVVASTQSLLQCGYPADVLASFGTVVHDEADEAAASTVRHLKGLLPARYYMGVSATPDRPDGLQHVVHWTLGASAFVWKRLQAVTGLRHTVRVLQVGATADMWRVPPQVHRWGPLKDKFNAQATCQLLADNADRNAFIVDLVRDALRQGRRRLLLFTAFVAHADAVGALCAAVAARAPGEVVVLHGQLPGGEGAVAAAAVAAKAPTTRVLVTTYAKLKRAWDDPDIDWVCFMLPTSDVRQQVGRSERERAGKQTPEVVDIVDEFGSFKASAGTRMRFYVDKSFAVARVRARRLADVVAARAAGPAAVAATPLFDAVTAPVATVPATAGSATASTAIAGTVRRDG